MKKTPGDIIILHMCTKNYDQMMYGSWDILSDRQTDGKSDISRWVPHLKAPKIKMLKMKKFAGDIIILYICTKNHNHMMYSSWDTDWDTKCFVILGHFLPFYTPSLTPLINPFNSQRHAANADVIAVMIWEKSS